MKHTYSKTVEVTPFLFSYRDARTAGEAGRIFARKSSWFPNSKIYIADYVLTDNELLVLVSGDLSWLLDQLIFELRRIDSAVNVISENEARRIINDPIHCEYTGLNRDLTPVDG